MSNVLKLACVLALLLTAAARAPDPDVLWNIVHDRCIPGEAHGDPSPCALVAPDYAILKDLKGVAQYLLIPTVPISGIDDPAVIQPEAGRLFAAAWDARRFLGAKLGRALKRDDVSLAVNSVDARTQEQLHIHIDCLRADVREALQSHADEIGPEWTKLTFPLAGQSYWAIRVDGEALGATNPFALLAQHVGGPAAMGAQALTVAGSERDGRPGFLVLARAGDAVHATELQDLACHEPG